MRQVIRRLAALVTASGLVLVAAFPASAAWTSSHVDTSYFLTRPSLRVDGTDHTGIAYQRFGNSPGIFYATNSTGSFAAGRVTTGSDEAPSLRFDTANKAHIAFMRVAGTTGVYVTDNVAGTWAAPTLVAADLDPTLPSLAIDGAGHLAVAWVSNFSFAPGLYYATNATGNWVTTRLTTGTWEATPALEFDATNHAHILFGRYAPDAPGIYYATNATGSWAFTRLTSSEDDSPSFAFDAAGKIQAAFRRFATGADALFTATNATGGWVVTQQAQVNTPEVYGPPAIAIDPISGNPQVYVTDYIAGAGGLLLDYKIVSGNWQHYEDNVGDDPARDDDFPSLGFLSNGTVQLAFRRVAPTQGLGFYSSGPTSAVIEGGDVNELPAMALGPSNARDVSIDRLDKTGAHAIFATGTGGAWTLGTAGNGDASAVRTDIAADAAGKVRIIDGRNYDSNATGSWASTLSLPAGSDAQVVVDSFGNNHVVDSEPSAGQFLLHYRIEVSPGTWMDVCACLNTSGDQEPSFVVDSQANPQVAFIDPGANSELIYDSVNAFEWTFGATIDAGPDSWPSIAIDGAGRLHIAYVHGGSAPGVYYATNKSGTWVKTRLTRSYSDGAPSIAVDSTGHAYIATTRASWAADPGVYVMTNATGSWVRARVVATSDAGDVSLDVTGGGLSRMVFATSGGVVEYEDSASTLIASADPLATALRDQLALAADAELAQPVSTDPPASESGGSRFLTVHGVRSGQTASVPLLDRRR